MLNRGDQFLREEAGRRLDGWLEERRERPSCRDAQQHLNLRPLHLSRGEARRGVVLLVGEIFDVIFSLGAGRPLRRTLALFPLPPRHSCRQLPSREMSMHGARRCKDDNRHSLLTLPPS